jgi:hypothetical protein
VDADRERLAAAEDRMADAEQAVAVRLHALADHLPDPETAHARAELMAASAERHRERARRLRQPASPDEGRDVP